jgi:hypothetical protein
MHFSLGRQPLFPNHSSHKVESVTEKHYQNLTLPCEYGHFGGLDTELAVNKGRETTSLLT